MYPSVSSDYNKSPPPSAPPFHNEAPIGIPVGGPPPIQAPGVWSSGLCDCCDDVSNYANRPSEQGAVHGERETVGGR
nr:protein PLANT CADMIUM RESISTANCE 2-like [Ipomoea batatas]